MTLNKQLLCVSLLLLSLPWAGCQYLKEMDASLRSGQETTLQATTAVIATALAQKPETLHPHGQLVSEVVEADGIYCHPLATIVRADGYGEEWSDVPWVDYQSGEQKLRYRCGVFRNELALFFSVDDDAIVYNNPSHSLVNNGDRVLVTTGSGREYIFTAVAPGKITPRYFLNPHTTYRESQIDASWIDDANGYQLEIKMPMSLAQGKLSFSVVDEDFNTSTNNLHNIDNKLSKIVDGSIDKNNDAPIPWFVYQSPDVEQTILPFSQQGLRLRLTNRQGLLTASAGDLEVKKVVEGNWLLRKLYRAILADNEYSKIDYLNGVDYSGRDEVASALSGATASQWYRDAERTTHHILTAAVPVTVDDRVVAVVVAEQSSEQTAALTDQAFSRLFLLSLTVIAVTAFALLAYASWLSLRIRRLSKATQDALDERGNISVDYPTSRANDEIGSLTRNYAELMKRIQEYTQYLQTLSRKLSHELRTPLAIIHSSLDNLASHSQDEQSKIYQQRAKDGALRLGNILTAMSEAKRVEESIEHAELEPVHIQELLWQVTNAYNDIYQQHRVVIVGVGKNERSRSNDTFNAVPDLLVQMLDKLMDNAVSFCPIGGTIKISFEDFSDNIVISVSNNGPLLPESMQSQLFDNMVSLRNSTNDSDDSEMHLGLGLHIVNLIVQYHQGSIKAENLSDNTGVVFTVSLPKHRV
jgi:dedicated sortase system histidine kinase